MKYSFLNDYAEGAHPTILQKLSTTNRIQQVGYGQDFYSLEAANLIKEKLENPAAKIFFISGGTQANLLIISSLLLPHEAVISAESGHIAEHEAGAIEATGHKVLTAPTKDGKLQPEQLRPVLEQYSMRPHVVKPRLVYISNASELGTIYTKNELRQLYRFCQENNLLLFMDGARLGVALTASTNDLTFPDLAHYTDVFYIGGTKNGALLGEAVVFNKPELCKYFDYQVKQKGALLAKGRLLGIQFLTLFQTDLFFELAQHANDLAQKIARELENLGFPFLLNSPTNQIFPILSKTQIEKLHQQYSFLEWKQVDAQNTAIRLVTSWATQQSDIDRFIEAVKNL